MSFGNIAQTIEELRGFLGVTARLVWRSRYDAFFFCQFIVIGSFQSMIFARDISPIAPVFGAVFAIAAVVWRLKAFPTLDWRGRVKADGRD